MRDSPRRRASPALPLALVATLLLIGLATSARAYLIQTAQVGSRVVAVAWPSDVVSYHLDAAGSDDLGAATTLRILRESFDVWTAVPGSRLRYRDAGTVTGRRPSRRDGLNLVIFDETGDLLGAPAGSGIIAATRLQSETSTGRILDADIIFNGRDFRFAEKPGAGRVLLRDVAVHEIGHFLGLEHTPLSGDAAVRPTMNPFYFDDGPGEAATLAADDEAGVSALYPTPAWLASTGTIEGHVTRLEGVGVFGAHVVAENLDSGALVSTLTGAETGRADAGAFRLHGLIPGPYRIHIEPVTGAVDESNLSGIFADLDTDFPAEYDGNTTDPAAATVVQLDTVTRRATGVDFITGFINPGEPYVVALDAPGNTPDTVGPYTLRFDIANAERAWILIDAGAAPLALEMDRVGGDVFEARLPGQPRGTRVRYRVRAVSDTGVVTEAPLDDGWFGFDVISLSGQPLAYTVLRQAGAVGVFDTDSRSEVARIDLGVDPIQILPARDGSRLYVSDLHTGDVVVVDAATFRVVDRIAVADEPLDMALSPDGGILYVTNSGAGSVSVVDLASGQVTDHLLVGDAADGPFGIAATADAVYVTDLNRNLVLALADGGVRARIPVPGGPRSLALTPDGARLLVTSFSAGDLTVIDTATDAVEAVVKLPVSGTFAVAVAADGATAYLTAHAEGVVVAVDLASLTVRTTVPVGADPRGLSFSPAGDRLYVTTAGDDRIHILTVDDLVTLSTVTAVGGPRGISVLAAPAIDTLVGDTAQELPAAWALSAAWPNPFNSETHVTLDVAGAGPVWLEVYDVLGQRLRSLRVDGLEAGRRVLTWDGRDDDGGVAGSGAYLFVVRTPDQRLVARKVLLLR